MPFTTALNTPYTTEVVSRDFIPAINEATPQILWVGCSDSIISETEVLDVQREQLFVHRNLGNILSNGDLSSESAVEWAVGLLQVSRLLLLIQVAWSSGWIRSLVEEGSATLKTPLATVITCNGWNNSSADIPSVSRSSTS
ncbi:hypothetical protein BP5796_02773 [Coleophoma crateriformis]|uniref:Carbonic anhydrase n=1 Tax=Coleophoma crateriformis TaxID=565419 RepID=A0A3D8T0S6_9HELO|nr:hypothetical protein BP5796_02773 [Coleophoma crateriformis]